MAFAFRYPPSIPCLSPSFRVSGLAPGLVQEVGRPLRTPGILWLRPSQHRCFGKETIGSPEFPGYPHEYMTWSQTPVVTLNTCLDAFRSTAFQLLHTVGFPLSIQVYPMTTTLHFSGLNTDPVALIHLASDPRYQVYPQASLLPCWLSFRQVGLESLDPHPLGNVNPFHPTSWDSQGSELRSARRALC